MTTTARVTPLVLVATEPGEQAAGEIAAWQSTGAVVVPATTPAGCLRVATATAPDVIVLNPRWATRVLPLLRAHPASRTARIQPLAAPAATTTLATVTLANAA